MFWSIIVYRTKLPQPNQQPKTTIIIIGKNKPPPHHHHQGGVITFRAVAGNPECCFLVSSPSITKLNKKEDNLNIFENGRRPQIFGKRKTTSIFKIEDNLIKNNAAKMIKSKTVSNFENARRPQFLKNKEGRLSEPCYLKFWLKMVLNWSIPSETWKWLLNNHLSMYMLYLLSLKIFSSYI